MSTDLERFTPYVRDLSKKQQTTAQSLEKIEDGVSSYIFQITDQVLNLTTLAAYAIVVRGSEYDLPPEMLDDIVSMSVLNVGNRGRRHKSNGEDALAAYNSDD